MAPEFGGNVPLGTRKVKQKNLDTFGGPSENAGEMNTATSQPPIGPSAPSAGKATSTAGSSHRGASSFYTHDELFALKSAVGLFIQLNHGAMSGRGNFIRRLCRMGVGRSLMALMELDRLEFVKCGPSRDGSDWVIRISDEAIRAGREVLSDGDGA